jgi:hypothetical protein
MEFDVVAAGGVRVRVRMQMEFFSVLVNRCVIKLKLIGGPALVITRPPTAATNVKRGRATRPCLMPDSLAG